VTYVLLDLVFLAAAALVAIAAGLRQRPSRRRVAAIASALVVVLALTAIFDNVMIGVGLVAYDTTHTSGLRLGLAPVEDFAYPIAVALLLPALWTLLAGRRPARGVSAPRGRTRGAAGEDSGRLELAVDPHGGTSGTGNRRRNARPAESGGTR
jgi:lycopene cyclase domain-containing protein